MWKFDFAGLVLTCFQLAASQLPVMTTISSSVSTSCPHSAADAPRLGEVLFFFLTQHPRKPNLNGRFGPIKRVAEHLHFPPSPNGDHCSNERSSCVAPIQRSICGIGDACSLNRTRAPPNSRGKKTCPTMMLPRELGALKVEFACLSPLCFKAFRSCDTLSLASHKYPGERQEREGECLVFFCR